MDIWHRVGRIVRFSNLGTLLFFTLNILLIVAVFGSSGSIVELICIYFFTVAISLSPLGEIQNRFNRPFGNQQFFFLFSDLTVLSVVLLFLDCQLMKLLIQ